MSAAPNPLVDMIARHPWALDEDKRLWCLGCLDGKGESLRQFADHRAWSQHVARLIAGEYLLVPRMPEVEAGQVYRHPDENLADLRIARRLRTFGLGQVGMLPSPLPVIGRVWVATVGFPLGGDIEILCTAEGLARRGYTLADITKDTIE